jgi:tetratricopeptide (TPR) repeat protein
MKHSLTILLASVLISGGVGPAAAQTSPAERLAGQYVRIAQQLISNADIPSRDTFDGVILLLRQSIALDRDSVETWRMLRDVAQLAERDDLRREATIEITRLDPLDDVARLMRVNDALEQFHTVEELESAYRKLLEPMSRAQLGPAVASRLATDLAALLGRSGRTEEYGRWLGEALALDPSNTTAGGLAAGYFRMHVDDPFAEAELLTNLVLANPASEVSATALAELLLEHGAYRGAERLYGLASDIRDAGRLLIESDLIADQAIATWAAGDADGALKLIEARRREFDSAYRVIVRQRDPLLTSEAVAAIKAPLPPTLIAVRAAIHDRLVNGQNASLRALLEESVSHLRNPLEGQEPVAPGEAAAETAIAAMVLLWFGDDVTGARELLEAADGLAPLTDEAHQRFEGWMSLREGRFDEAIERLQPLEQAYPIALLGRSLAQIGAGQRAEGARGLLRLTQEQPGTLIGVWARDRLRELLGQSIPPSELATRLDNLIDSIPDVLFQFRSRPSLGVELTLEPARPAFSPFEPITINVVITNHSPFPLAIDPLGPIRPHVLLRPSLRLTRQPEVGEVGEIVVDISRRLRLEPKQRVVVPVDLRRHEVAEPVNAAPFLGAHVQVRGVSNCRITPRGASVPTLLGTEAETSLIRIEGVRVDLQWIDQALEAIRQPDEPGDLPLMAVLASVLAGQLSAAATPAELEMFARAEREFAEAFARLDDVSRAWLLGVLADSPRLAAVFEQARASENRWVRLSYMLHRVNSATDPVLLAAKASDDQGLREVATLLESLIVRTRQGILIR